MTIDLGNPRVLSPDDADRQVLLADPRGYCAGVDRAVVTVEEALDLYGAPVYVRKQIVHNKHVVSNLEKRGAIFVEELDEVPVGATVVFSAHGVSPAVHVEAAERELKTIDATCPLVTKVHREAVAVRARGLHHPADRPRRSRGGRGHRRARRPSRPSWSSTPTTSTPSSSRPTPSWPGSRRPRSASTRRWRPSAGCARSSRSSRTRRATTSATRPRTARWRSRRSAPTADLVIVVGSGQLVQLGAPGRGRARGGRQGVVPRRRRLRDRRGLARRRPRRSA